VSGRAVEVHAADGSDPIAIVDTAIRIKKDNKNLEQPYNDVWLVFDTEDNRIHLKEAINKAVANKIKLAISAPSIEFWFLLHFGYTTKYMVKCHDVERELRQHFDYSKETFDSLVLIGNTATAIDNARLLRKNQENTNSEFPKTDVDLLVTQINAMADNANRLFDNEESQGTQ
jgi:hypothetical protein